MVPKCYFGNVVRDVNGDGDDDSFPEGTLQLLCGVLFKKDERGVLILEDCSKGETPYYQVDKTKVPSLDLALLVMRQTAHFHGAWWKAIHADGGFGEKKEFRRRFAFRWTEGLLKYKFKELHKSCLLLLKNRRAKYGDLLER